MPLCPQITNTPITVSLTADYTVTNVVPVLPANTEQLAAVKLTADNAYTDAAAAAAAAAAASAIAATAVQTSANTIVNASNQLTAINGNGITVYAGSSATSGARVVLNSSGLAGFNAGGSATLAISASTGTVEVTGGILSGGSITGTTINVPSVGSPAFSVNALGAVTATNLTLNGGQIFLNGGVFSVSSLGALTATNANITGTINSSSGTIGGFTIASTYLSGSGGFTLYSNGTIDGGLSNTIFYGYANIGGGPATGERFIVTGNSSFVGQAIFSGNTTSQTHFFSPFANNVTASANGYWVSTSGRMTYTTASSQRYKHDIVDLINIPEYDPKKLLALPVRAFRYNEHYVTPTDDRAEVLIPGFIAEEVDAIYPIACDYSETKGPESWNDRVILPAMLALIQEQEARIQVLEGK